MADFLIRGLPEDAPAAVGPQANEHVRGELRTFAQQLATPVTVDDLRRFSSRFADLADQDVMDKGWK